jgi:hypothetical protein
MPKQTHPEPPVQPDLAAHPEPPERVRAVGADATAPRYRVVHGAVDNWYAGQIIPASALDQQALDRLLDTGAIEVWHGGDL